MVQFLQPQYQKLGIKIDIETVDSRSPMRWSRRTKSTGPRRIGRHVLIPMAAANFWYSTGFQNTTKYKNPDLDKSWIKPPGV